MCKAEGNQGSLHLLLNLVSPCRHSHSHDQCWMQSIERGELGDDGESALWAWRFTLRAGPRAGTVDAPSFLTAKVCPWT